MLFEHISVLVTLKLKFYRPACQCWVSLYLACMWDFLDKNFYFGFGDIFHVSQAFMAVVSTWLVDSQVRKANVPQEIEQ